jgi:hypothetical protein
MFYNHFLTIISETGLGRIIKLIIEAQTPNAD